KNIQVIDYARKNHVIILCLPPHTTHRLQPLDVAVMKPLSNYYSTEIKKWLRSHPGRVVTPNDIPDICCEALKQAGKAKTII
ncbi:GSCOCG00012344001-RA-CDS, partial [Cotesia congregata]